MTLEQIRAREQAATEGPWEFRSCPPCTERGRIDVRIIADGGNALIADWCDDDEYGQPDAEFIAHARQDVPMLLAAVDAVLALHERFGLYELEDSCPNTDDEHRQERHRECSNEPSELYCADMPTGAKCGQCSDEYGDDVEWPCPTVQAITQALEQDVTK